MHRVRMLATRLAATVIAGPLAVRLGAPGAATRAAAAFALGVAAPGAATAALERALADTAPDVRANAAWALGQTGRRSAPAGLVRADGDADPDVRLKAAWAPGQTRDPAAIPAVRDALARDAEPHVRRALVNAVPNAEHTIAPLLDFRDPQVREAAVRALASREAFEPWPWLGRARALPREVRMTRT